MKPLTDHKLFFPPPPPELRNPPKKRTEISRWQAILVQNREDPKYHSHFFFVCYISPILSVRYLILRDRIQMPLSAALNK